MAVPPTNLRDGIRIILAERARELPSWQRLSGLALTDQPLPRTRLGRFKAFLAGVGVTSILQSSTATGLMVTAFAAGGLVDLVPALAVMLGANVGTTLIVQVLSPPTSQLSFLAPSVFLQGGVPIRLNR